MKSVIDLDLKKVCGLVPDVWLCVGAGFAREDLKALILSTGSGFVGHAVLSVQELCTWVLGVDSSQIPDSLGRQEILRILFAEPGIQNRFPELRRLRRQKDFFRRLDHALQTGRLAFSHSEEEAVFNERLEQSLGVNLIRDEIRLFANAYEAWMIASQCYDLPLLLRMATERLQDSHWNLKLPKEIWLISLQTPESLERNFWDILGEKVQIRQFDSLFANRSSAQNLSWERWHTLDDAAESLADRILENAEQRFRDHVILIPDQPGIRRSLRRALESRNLPLAEPRDPTQLLWAEELKWAMLPLEAVARNYPRQTFIAWLRYFAPKEKLGKWISEINARGIRYGIYNYRSGHLSELEPLLSELYTAFSGRKTVEELAEAHLKYLRDHLPKSSNYSWVIRFLTSIWEGLKKDFERTLQTERKAPALFWYERLQARVRSSSPPVDGIKPEYGVQMYRLQQAPVRPIRQLWIFGMPTQWLDSAKSGSYWFSDWEREILASEFAVRSSVQIRGERIQALRSWVGSAESCVVLDAHYDFDGRERESLAPVLQEICFGVLEGLPEAPLDQGAYPKFRKSYQSARGIQPQKVRLSHSLPKRPELTATELDRYSRCPFQALAYHRWKVEDLREPGPDLWPEVRGTLLHEAVRILLDSRLGKGFTVSPQGALEKAWLRRPPKGLVQSSRIKKHILFKLEEILLEFAEKEKKYQERSGAEPIVLDNAKIRLEYDNFSIVGKPDRIDEVPEGFFVMDYKTSGAVPTGADMVSRGYRLQLPFYALAIAKKTGRDVLGAQFVELDRKGSRSSGIFFKDINGKEPGKLTDVRSTSKSLLILDRNEVWTSLETQLISSAQAYVEGYFDPLPNVEFRQRECGRCRVQDLCGFRRLTLDEAVES